MIRKAKHPLWSPEDNDRLGALFNENGPQKSLNWYQEQFKPKQKQFVEIQLSYLTKDDRSKMPQYERLWTQENLDKLMEYSAKYYRNFRKVATEIFGDASKAE